LEDLVVDVKIWNGFSRYETLGFIKAGNVFTRWVTVSFSRGP